MNWLIKRSEFSAIDPDGAIFWYEIVSYPTHGSLEQFGGSKRKFSYTPNEDFSGQDTVIFYAIDDENTVGENGMYIMNILEDLSVKYQTQLLPESFKLSQNYPNPFNPITTINYQTPEQNLLTISIYNMNGQIVETLVNEEKTPGKYSVSWIPSGFSSGLYFYNLTVGNKTSTRKMLLLK